MALWDMLSALDRPPSRCLVFPHFCGALVIGICYWWYYGSPCIGFVMVFCLVLYALKTDCF